MRWGEIGYVGGCLNLKTLFGRKIGLCLLIIRLVHFNDWMRSNRRGCKHEVLSLMRGWIL